jgi:hypothetical protein
MCRRQTGAALVYVTVPGAAICFEDRDHIPTFRSSDWAERASRDGCGAGLDYRITLDGPMQGSFEIALGLFDTPDGVPLVSEAHIDRKPNGYAFAGDHARLTMADGEAMFSDVLPTDGAA